MHVNSGKGLTVTFVEQLAAKVKGHFVECYKCVSVKRWCNIRVASCRLPSQPHDSSSACQRRGSPISSEERRRRDRKHLDDITAARLLPLHHLPTQLLSIEESLALQRQQKQSYEVFRAWLFPACMLYAALRESEFTVGLRFSQKLGWHGFSRHPFLKASFRPQLIQVIAWL